MALPSVSTWNEAGDYQTGNDSGSTAFASDRSFFSSWSDRVKGTFGRQIEALQRAQDERNFMDTGHGSQYGPCEVFDLEA